MTGGGGVRDACDSDGVTTLPPQLLSWAARAVAPSARVVGVVSLGTGADVPVALALEGAGAVERVVLRVGRPERRPSLATEVAALTVAALHGIPAPALIAADLDGEEAGTLAVLTTLVPGSSAIPVHPPRGRLRRLGAAAARMNAVALEPTPELGLRTRPMYDADFDAWRREDGSTPLLERAEAYLAGVDPPSAPLGLVHGDLWQGNALDDGRRLTGLIDWDCAGVGPAGIDICCPRFDAAVCFGLDAADEITAGWSEAAGSPPRDVDYWDVVAGLCTPPDVGTWVPLIHAQGRTDIDARLANERRGAFLRAALERLGVL